MCEQNTALTIVLIEPKNITGEQFKMFSAIARLLMRDYIDKVNDQENPHVSTQKGFTTTELDARRTRAHNKLMQQLAQEGIDTTDRSAITEMAKRYERWMPEED